MPLAPQTALITGAARRIGRAIALDLAAHGWRVAIHYRNSRDEAEALAERDPTGGRGRGRGLPPISPTSTMCNRSSRVAPTRSARHLPRQQRLGIFPRHDRLGDAGRLGHAPRHQFEGAGVPGAGAVRQPARRASKATSSTSSISGCGGRRPTSSRTRSPKPACGPRRRRWRRRWRRACASTPSGPARCCRACTRRQADFAAETLTTPLQRGPSLPEIAAAVRFILATPSMTGQMIALDGGQHLA